METALPFLMFATLFVAIMLGFPVAFTLGGVAILYGCIGAMFYDFRMSDFSFVPERIYGIVDNLTLIAVPLFIFMGITLEKSGMARELLESMQQMLRRLKGGLAISVVIVGALLAASTGIVGATVVTMGAMALPTMLKWGYNRELACGTISASGTLGQIIPPSIVLVILGDMMNIDIGSLFIGSLLPGVLLVVTYIVYIWLRVKTNPSLAPLPEAFQDPNNHEGLMSTSRILKSLIPPAILMIVVLGSILFGIATPTESSACGALGALIITFAKRRLDLEVLRGIMKQTAMMTSMVFTILVGAQFFGVVFRGLHGDYYIETFISDMNVNRYLVLIIVMLMMFVMGFFLDFIEICFIIVPIIAPILIKTLGLPPLWLAILFAMNLQTSFLTPPFGFALFYLKGVAPPEIQTKHIYKGIIPFVCLQILVLLIIAFFPDLTTWLPELLNGKEKFPLPPKY